MYLTNSGSGRLHCSACFCCFAIGGTPLASAWVISGAACAFALLPYYPYGLCIAGQPLLFYAMLNLSGGKHKLASLCVVAAYPFFSSLVLIGYALVPIFGIYWAVRVWATRKLNAWLLAAVVLLITGYVVCNYGLIQGLLAPSGFVSSRTEFNPVEGLRITTALKTAAQNMLFGQYHAASSQFPFILTATLLALATCIARRTTDDRISWQHGWKGIVGEGGYSPSIVYLIVLLFVAAALSLIYGLAGWSGTIALLKASHIGLLRTFQFERVHWLHPLVWGVIFACALEQIVNKVRSGKAIAIGILALHLVMLTLSNASEAPDLVSSVFLARAFRKNTRPHQSSARHLPRGQPGHFPVGGTLQRVLCGRRLSARLFAGLQTSLSQSDCQGIGQERPD